MIARHAIRNIVRNPVKTLYAVAVAALLFVALAQFTVMRESYNVAHESVETEVSLTGYISLKLVWELEDSGLLKDTYYETKSEEVEVNGSSKLFKVTNNVSRASGEEVEVIYAEGYDGESFQNRSNLCIISSRMMEELGIVPGEELRIHSPRLYEKVTNEHVEAYLRKEGISLEQKDKVAIPHEVLDDIESELNGMGKVYIIAGYAQFPVESDPFNHNTIFTGGQEGISDVIGYNPTISIFQGTLISNFNVDTTGRLIDSIIKEEHLLKPVVVHMNTEKVDNLMRTMNLLDIVYPILLSVVATLSGVFPGLIIVQNSRAASLARVLGISRIKIGIQLIAEQFISFLIGIALGWGVVVLLNESIIMPILKNLILITVANTAAFFIMTIASTMFICSKKPVELLLK